MGGSEGNSIDISPRAYRLLIKDLAFFVRQVEERGIKEWVRQHYAQKLAGTMMSCDHIKGNGKQMLKQISTELKNHAPFTLFGALTGIIVMVLFSQLPSHTSYTIFYILHPIHVLLSALVTSSIFMIHKHRNKSDGYILPALLVIGFTGSLGIATLSDSIIPFLGETLLNMPKREIHIGFIEKWWLVNPLAFLGICIAYFRPATKFPHAGHVLFSTWASLFHMIMALGENLNIISYLAIFMFLFLAVWIPCCVSDIVFPLLFTKERGDT